MLVRLRRWEVSDFMSVSTNPYHSATNWACRLQRADGSPSAQNLKIQMFQFRLLKDDAQPSRDRGSNRTEVQGELGKSMLGSRPLEPIPFGLS